MRFTSFAVVAAAASLVSAQGYNSTSAKPSNSSAPYDSRTVNVPAPSTTPATVITSIGTIYSSCGSLTVLLPSTKLYPVSGNGTIARSSTYTGSAGSSPTGGSANKVGAALAGVGAVVAGALIL